MLAELIYKNPNDRILDNHQIPRFFIEKIPYCFIVDLEVRELYVENVFFLVFHFLEEVLDWEHDDPGLVLCEVLSLFMNIS